MKSLLLFGVLLLGCFFPAASYFSFLIYYFLFLMLCFSFTDVEVSRKVLTFTWIKHNISIFYVLVLNLILPIGLFFLLRSWNYDFAVLAFVTAISPTATAAPVISSLIKMNTQYVVFCVLLSNLSIALLLPVLFAVVFSDAFDISTQFLLVKSSALILLPLFIIQICKRYFKKFYAYIQQNKKVNFYIWLFLLFLAGSKVSNFLLHAKDISFMDIVIAASMSFVICIVNFLLGYLVGGKNHAREARQSLGHKNTIFSLWIALEFLSPFYALGPIFYIIFHNVYNSYQMSRKV